MTCPPSAPAISAQSIPSPRASIPRSERSTRWSSCASFTLTRRAVDDVARGSNDSDWQPLKTPPARSRWRTTGWSSTVIKLRASTASCPKPATPSWRCPRMSPIIRGQADARRQPVAAGRREQAYALVLGTAAFTAATGGAEDGYPIAKHLESWSIRSGVEPGFGRRRGGDHPRRRFRPVYRASYLDPGICRMMPVASPCIFRNADLPDADRRSGVGPENPDRLAARCQHRAKDRQRIIRDPAMNGPVHHLVQRDLAAVGLGAGCLAPSITSVNGLVEQQDICFPRSDQLRRSILADPISAIPPVQRVSDFCVCSRPGLYCRIFTPASSRSS